MQKQELVERFKKALDDMETEEVCGLRINPVCIVVDDIKTSAARMDSQFIDNLLSATADEMLGTFKDDDLEFFFRELKFVKVLDTTQESFLNRYCEIRACLYIEAIEPYLGMEAPRPKD